MFQPEILAGFAWVYLIGACVASAGLSVVFLFALFIGHRWMSSPKELWNYALWSIALWPLLLGTIIHLFTSRREPS